MKRERRRPAERLRERCRAPPDGKAAETDDRGAHTADGLTIVQGTRAAARTTASAASLLRPYGVSGRGTSSSRVGRLTVPVPIAAWLEMRIRRAPVAFTASTTARVPADVDASKADRVERPRQTRRVHDDLAFTDGAHQRSPAPSAASNALDIVRYRLDPARSDDGANAPAGVAKGFRQVPADEIRSRR